MSDLDSDETYANGIVDYAIVPNDVDTASPEEVSTPSTNTNRSVAGRHASSARRTARRINSYSLEELRRKVAYHESKESADTRALKMVKYELRCWQAILRQYRRKLQKVRTVAMAGLSRDDMTMELGNSMIERGCIETDVPSDREDNHPHNRTAYSYIDNELFNQED